MFGKTERRLALVILLTAIVPLAMAVLMAKTMLDSAKSLWIQPDVLAQLDRGIDLYKDYVRAVKDDLKNEAQAMAGDDALRAAARTRDAAAVSRAFDDLIARDPRVIALAVEDADGHVLATRDRPQPVNDAVERTLPALRESLGETGGGAVLLVTFAVDDYEKGLARAGEVRDGYEKMSTDPNVVYLPVYKAFAALLGITAIATIVLGSILARGFTRPINRLSQAIDQVAEGNLDVRVPETGSDELADLARVFNRMLSEMQQSRARIEYLQRIGQWQQMAQRLAHEIKNPLTPIQLAVQECHRKYAGDDPRFRALLDTTLEIVEEEVGTLRRLVGNFSSFARLPHADLREADLRSFLRECSEQLGHLGAELAEEGADDVLVAHDVQVRWEVPDAEIPAAIDRQMLRRVLVNLVRNAVEAIRDARPAARDGEPRGRVVVRVEATGDGADILVEDDGPGVPEAARDRIFDPYFTTKATGTGLGLAIVKKVVVEHNGSISVRASERLGGAAFVVSLPQPHSLAIAAARDGDPASAPPSSRPVRRPAA